MIVEPDVAVAEVAEGLGLAAEGLLLDHAVHDARDEGLVHVVAVQVPRAPAARGAAERKRRP